jgi:hypothetical protein
LSSAHSVQVSYRHIELAADATLEPAEDGCSRLRIATPPPVRTVVAITHGEQTRAYAVVSVQEVVAAGGSRSCLVREVGDEALPVTVGTEHHRAGALGEAPESARDGDARDDGESIGSSLAVPAPVVADDSDQLETGEGTGDGAAAGAGDASEASGAVDPEGVPTDNGSEESGTIDVGTGGEATTSDGGGRGKKRRGRQRK